MNNSMYNALREAGFSGMIDDNTELNSKLDKYSQPMKPGPNLGRERINSVASILRGSKKVSSAKGKHASNLTPKKKKRK